MKMTHHISQTSFVGLSMATNKYSDRIIALAATAALVNDAKRGVVHKRFAALREGALILSVRVSPDQFTLCWLKEGDAIQEFNRVPAEVWQSIYNRARTVDHNVVPVALIRHVQAQIDDGSLVPFNSVKKGKLIEYTSRGTFPDNQGIIEEEGSGRRREAFIIGAPEPGAKGLMSLMTDRSIIFVPT